MRNDDSLPVKMVYLQNFCSDINVPDFNVAVDKLAS